MPSEDDTHEAPVAEIIKANSRPWNSYRFWRDKPVGERGVAQAILSGAGIIFENLVSRVPGDPPDCEAVVEKDRIGIEVTELVHQRTLKRSLKAQKTRAEGRTPDSPEVYFVWDQSELLRALRGRINAKDRAKLKGGPYSRATSLLFMRCSWKPRRWSDGLKVRPF